MADVVSRIQPMESIFMALSTCHPLLLQQLQQFYTSHVAGLTLMPKFCTPANVKEPFFVQLGIFYYINMIFIPLESGLYKGISKDFHDSHTRGHCGIQGTIACLSVVFSWPHMTTDVKLFIREYLICQSSK